MNNQNQLYDIGVIGLGVMGKNLALNIADNQYRVAAFDLDELKVKETVRQEELERKQYLKHLTQARILGCNNLSELLSSLEKPRILLLSVPAGAPVDGVCESLIEAGIESDDIVIDTGNSLWTDTVDRELSYNQDFHFFSCAVSGGEVGARFGPSLMPSGSLTAWNRIEPIWQAIAAKVDTKTGLPIERFEPGNPVTEGEPCTTYIGPAGSGHYVKMVHNGIEYADMQLICEAYHLLSQGLGLSASEVGDVFERWNKGSLNSYLMEISADVLKQADPLTAAPLVEMILDKAGQKGTGLWTAVSSLQIGCPAPTIAEAVYARAVSTQKTQRQQLSKLLAGPSPSLSNELDKQAFIDQLEHALYCAKVSCYAQGFQLMAMQAKEMGWQLDFAEIAKIWRAGCIIRATFLQSITQAYQQDSELENLLMADVFAKQLSAKQDDWRIAVSQAVMSGVPVPCISSALAYYDSYRSSVLPANLLQGQRDYFGAHTFERTDKPAGEKYHLNWSSDRKLNKL
ncbi:NADP-dependent phosphogluconate dehydrogenase [Shewanella fidelis]|uniref:6-phosphogluconate dehydrogenase, decarboxylating n=1 Tax=Shewanella fidelis TaxID=173509 RepID=A0AAW8NIW9_9GAMM|nr:NADP-dependent phosphogluconate dehydrogenase [Shewanella fidelis]MDR8523138.1 NADP-dependent phosphogluconate dehydrogenase [Shewanella fidelis]MDW4811536.1 NADP-dependent phosphogluconate dehydrogenase [Shewanella fidelis]MDW4815657.1 NADP-dependent phosphogluconate dehydrogenase [Shewanella fidelis]MDW4819747.1 NADP-dependent phosphogluconate dehydrogenase [Shewanella fidelis]MDW4824279.1 NADP-dependent phosphogluconate dehydrogenase [Shewanella fidelis]